MRVMALDFGSARTGVAVSDATGTLARPVCVVERATTVRGSIVWSRSWASTRRSSSWWGSRSRCEASVASRRATEDFVAMLRSRIEIPVETFDERFTTTLAQQTGGRAPEDALAAAHLLQGWLSARDEALAIATAAAVVAVGAFAVTAWVRVVTIPRPRRLPRRHRSRASR